MTYVSNVETKWTINNLQGHNLLSYHCPVLSCMHIDKSVSNDTILKLFSECRKQNTEYVPCGSL